MFLQTRDMVFDGFPIREHGRYHHDGPKLDWNARTQFQPGQEHAADLLRDKPIDDGNSNIRGRHKAGDRQGKKPPAGRTSPMGNKECEGQDNGSDDGDHADIAHHADF